MSKFSITLILAAGLGLSAAALSYAEDSPAKPAKMLGHLSIVKHQGVCIYSCPPGKTFCPGDINPRTGCYYYTCFKGRIGGEPCP
jgi:hypothetical protein